LALPLPENASVGVLGTSRHNDQMFVSASSFLVPTTLYLVNSAESSP